jgi:hypothetical protein
VSPLLIAVWSAAAVVWHVVMGNPWLDSFVFASILGTSQVAVQWWMDHRHKGRRRDQR